jgi:type IV secretory pathway protease TraF
MRARGYSERTIGLVRAVSRLPEDRAEQSYGKWIDKLAASGDRGAIRLKLVDNEDNLDPARLALLSREQQTSLRSRYGRSVRKLKQALHRLDRTLPPEQPGGERPGPSDRPALRA